MNSLLRGLALVFSLSVFAAADLPAAEFPLGPDEGLTPGELCLKPSRRRYPERIAYCERSVSSALKDAIVDEYDEKLGYEVGEMGRQRFFKIDHLIPLCMGGSNSRENLWPQHQSIYVKTDPLEQLACEKMAAGRLKQADAVSLILTAKRDLSQVDRVRQQLLNY